MRLIYFLGRFHVLLVHLPIGFILAVIILEWVSRREKYQHLRAATSLLWGLAAIFSLITAALGYMHFAEGGFTGWSAQYHRISGTAVAALALLVWIAHDRFPSFYKRVEIPSGLVLFAVLLVAGHTGSNLTHGSTYLFDYAPQSVRSLVGLPPVSAKAVTAPGAVQFATSDAFAAADPFNDVIEPIFNSRCSNCHGDEVQKNQLSLTSYKDVMKGGKSGPDVVPGDVAHSELFRRISLPKDNKDFMPAQGKPPLTAAEVQIVRWWIESGAKTGVKLAAMDVPPDIKSLLVAEVKNPPPVPPPASAAPETAATASLPAPVSYPADPKLLDVLSGAGFSVRQVARDNPRLLVAMISPGEPLTDSGLSALSSSAGEIEELDLQRTGMGDEQARKLGQFSNLSHLRLDGNQISDGGLRSVAGLKHLDYLNLYGNKAITDASIGTLARIDSLKTVVLWNTGVTQGGVKSLKKMRPTLVVDFGEALQPPPLTPEQQAVAAYDKLMSPAVAANMKLQTSMTGDLAAVSSNAAELKTAFAAVEQYWTMRNVADAAAFAKNIEQAASDVQTAAAAGNQAGAGAAFGKIAENCQGCHTAHRVGNPDGTFAIK